jgi:RNA polymerase sigma-70 factor (ECF subfamily)
LQGQPETTAVEPNFDAHWRRTALGGDAQAIAQLARQALEPLYRFCLYRVGRRRELCEEVVQETLIKALRNLEKYDPSRCADDIFPWLCGIARNEVSRLLTRERNESSLVELWARMDVELRCVYAQLEAEPFSQEVLAREETCEMVSATMSQLPPQYRRALEAKYILGKSVRDIAAMLSMTEKAVESQLGRARAAFRETFLTLTRNLEIETR